MEWGKRVYAPAYYFADDVLFHHPKIELQYSSAPFNTAVSVTA